MFDSFIRAVFDPPLPSPVFHLLHHPLPRKPSDKEIASFRKSLRPILRNNARERERGNGRRGKKKERKGKRKEEKEKGKKKKAKGRKVSRGRISRADAR